ncbi:MAG: Pycsar system effector family protein, partial [Bacteroidota bacterium]
ARPGPRTSESENLAFFGYFNKLSRVEFAQRMEARLRDPNALYGTLIDELHGLGSSVRRKHDLLRMAYSVFLVGLIISAILIAGMIIF